MKAWLAAHRTFFTLLTVFMLGCAAQVATSHAISAAQSDPERGIYRECFSATLYITSGRDLNHGEIPDLVTIPAGWHVAAGGPGAAVLCR